MNGNEDTISAYAVKMLQLSIFLSIILCRLFFTQQFSSYSRSAVHQHLDTNTDCTNVSILDCFTLLLMHRPPRALFTGRFFQSHLYTCSEQKSFTSQGLHFLAFFPQVACYEQSCASSTDQDARTSCRTQGESMRTAVRPYAFGSGLKFCQYMCFIFGLFGGAMTYVFGQVGRFYKTPVAMCQNPYIGRS